MIGQDALAIAGVREREPREQHGRLKSLHELGEGTIASGGDERLVKRDVGRVEALLDRSARGTRSGVLHTRERRR